MQSCENCGNENLPEDSKYCNHCGVFLKLAKKPIQFKENKSFLYTMFFNLFI